MVSTGATMRARMRLTVSYVSRQRAGAGCGVSRAVGMAFGLREDEARFGLGRSVSAVDAVVGCSSGSCVLMFGLVALGFLEAVRPGGVGAGAESASAPSSED